MSTDGKQPTNTGRDSRGHFTKGGGPANPGRPKGSRNKATQKAEKLLHKHTGQITQTAIKLALSGDATALKLCMDRLVPVVKERPVAFDLPKMERAADLPLATAAILAAVGDGELTVGEAQRLAAMVADTARALETTELEERIAILEGTA